MIYNMRIYDLQPGAVQKYMDAVREVALKIREDHGVKLAGWHYTGIGTRLGAGVRGWGIEGGLGNRRGVGE